MYPVDVNILSDYTVFSDAIASNALEIIPMISSHAISPVNRVIDRWMTLYSGRVRDNRLPCFFFTWSLCLVASPEGSIHFGSDQWFPPVEHHRSILFTRRERTVFNGNALVERFRGRPARLFMNCLRHGLTRVILPRERMSYGRVPASRRGECK